jgi:hypothetical protein
MAPPITSPCLDSFPIVLISLKFSCLNIGVLSGLLFAHGVVGSTLTMIWIGVIPFFPALGPPVFLSYVAGRISSISP